MRHLLDLAAAGFEGYFGRPPRWFALAPGRVNLIGEHVDYNDGFVLPMAIERSVVIAGDLGQNRRNDENIPGPAIRVRSSDQALLATMDSAAPIVRGEPAWANYVRGVIAGFQQRDVWGNQAYIEGAELVQGFDAYIFSDLPAGGGLSSSAALEVATATLMEAVTNTRLDPVEKALLCQKAEHEFAGVPCGIMDQFASVMGKKDHLLLLDCRSREVELVPLNDPGVTVLIINSNVKHELTGGEYALRRRQCEEAAAALKVASLRDADMGRLERNRAKMDDVVFRRARHVITEIQRTDQAARYLRAGRFNDVGRPMYESHASLRDDFEVSCGELDAIVEIARSLGHVEPALRGAVIGCRMTGGGFGGCAVALVKTEHVDAVTQRIGDEYAQRTGRAATIFATRPAEGARLIQGVHLA